MIAHWVRAGKEWVALDEQKGVCGVLKWFDDETFVRGNKVSQIGVQEAETICQYKTSSSGQTVAN